VYCSYSCADSVLVSLMKVQTGTKHR